MPFTVYLDDSGTSPSQQVACATALIIPAPRLLAMESEWETLRAKEGFTDFHTSEYVARNYKSEFGDWKDEKHLRVFMRACDITKKYVVQIFSMAVNKPEYESAVPDDMRQYTGRYHYSWGVRHVLSMVQTWRYATPGIPPFEWVFDSMQPKDPARIEIENLLAECEAVAEMRRGVSGDYINYSFRNRKSLGALQCADLVAWTNYQFALEKFKGTPLSPFAELARREFEKKRAIERIATTSGDMTDWNCTLNIKPKHLKEWVEKEFGDGTFPTRYKEWKEQQTAVKTEEGRL